MIAISRLTFMLAFFAAVVAPVHSHELLAVTEAKALTEADKRAAINAEHEALDRDEVINSFEWKGPDGAEGLIIVSGFFPTVYGMGGCRRLVHIIKHKNDGGVNPTFSGVVCRDWEGKWSPEKR